MKHSRLEELVAAFPQKSILVVGDFYLDEYLILDRALTEVSAETGLDAYQIVAVRPQAGAAGTVAANLRALGATVIGLGVAGDDGRGLELMRCLQQMGVETSAFVAIPGWLTCAYIKPLMRERNGKQHELNRLDIRPRAPLAAEIEDAIIHRLEEIAPRVDGVAVVDHSVQRDCGVITDRVRGAIARAAARLPHKVFVADSRQRIGEFQNAVLKPNECEALRAAGSGQEFVSDVELERCARELYSRSGRGVVVTLGEKGMLVCDANGLERVPAVPAVGAIDIVGAGDSAMAGIVVALCGGADLREAARIGNLCAAVTIRQVGTTGTASGPQVLAMAREIGIT